MNVSPSQGEKSTKLSAHLTQLMLAVIIGSLACVALLAFFTIRAQSVQAAPLAQSSPVLTVTKRADPKPVVSAGEMLTYTIVISNGAGIATDVIVSDTLPANTSFVTATLPHTGPVSGVITWPLGALGIGVTRSVTMVVRVDSSVISGTVITNTAWVTCSQGVSSTGTVTTPVEVTADLTVVKSDSPDPVVAGTTLTYTLIYTNAGPSDAQDVTITDTLPVSVTYGGVVSVTPPLFGPTETLPYLTWYTPTLAAGGWGTIVFTVTVDPGASVALTNRMVITSSTPDPNTPDNIATEDTIVEQEADLVLSKTDYPDPVAAGTALVYTLTITNNGPSNATDVSLFDFLPDDGVSFHPTASSPSCTESPPGLVTCDVGGLIAGDSTTTTIVVTVASSVADGAILANQAMVFAHETDPYGSNNGALENTVVNREADLAISKTDHPDPVSAGALLTYTLTITNHGPSDATGIRLFDDLPDAPPGGVSFNPTASSPGCTEPASGIVTCSVGSLVADDSTMVTIVVTVASSVADGATLTNWAVVTENETDPNVGNNGTSENTTVEREADLTISKTGSPVVASTTLITYTLSITNHGPSDATGVVVADTLPDYTTFASASDGGIEASGVVTWPVFDMTGGTSVTRTVVVTIDNPLPFGINFVTNTVTVASDGISGTDPNLTNNTYTHTTQVEYNPDLRITKEGPATASVNETVIFTFTIANVIITPTSIRASATGDGSSISNITVTDTIASPVNLVSNGDGDGLLEVGEVWVYTATYTIQATDPNPLVNSGTVTGQDRGGNPTSNTDTHSTTIGSGAFLPIILKNY